MTKTWWLILGVVVGLVGGCGMLVRTLETNVLYHPSMLTSAEVQRLGEAPGWRVARIDATVPLVGLIRSPSSAAQPWLLLFAGNGMSLRDSQQLLQTLAQDAGWGLAVFAYRGYDGSGGEPSEAALKHDAYVAAQFLKDTEHVSYNRLVTVGYSLGSGIATHLAAQLSREKQPPAGLILGAAYTSIANVFDDHTKPIPTGWIAFDKYDSAALAPDVLCPVLLLHGDHDSMIDVRHSRAMHALFGARSALEVLAGGEHNNVFAMPQTRPRVVAFLEMVVGR